MEKELRNKKILDLHNSGESIRSIAKELGVGKTTVSEVIGKALDKGENVPPKEVVPVKLKGTEERFTNFSGYERLDVNVYSHKETGEIVQIAFVKAKSKDDFGYFVKLNN
jgi:lambda repressor-like predicted transcriptional regulator